MQEFFQCVQFPRTNNAKVNLDFLNMDVAQKAKRFHASFEVYSQTPLTSLPTLAKELGLGSIYVKDESYRFGLNAFKVLGGSYAVGEYIAHKLGEDIDSLSYSKMVSPAVKEKLGELTFVTATDGNHGRGLAWTVNKLGQKSVVYMPKGSAPERLANIQAENADASITELNYDEAVRLANSQAEEKGWIMVQDTAWDGYEDIPKWIMQGYTTMAYEAYLQLQQMEQKPTHIFIQAGVGSLAGAVQGFFASVWGEERPITTIVEPNKADCIFRTAQANDGKLHFVTGSMDTIMAGLACGEPNTVSWEVLHDYSDNFISCPDYVAAKGMRILASATGTDSKIVSGESGAAPFGFVAEVMTNPKLADLKAKLKLDENSRVLFFSTEGDTDKENYRNIVWDGKYPSYCE